MALSAPWTAGDDIRVLAALGLPISEYMRTGLQSCMNLMATDLVAYVQGELDRYEAAKAAQTTADLGNPDGRVLVEADVLKWAVGAGGVGTSRELMDSQMNIRNAFANCPYVPQDDGMGHTVRLVRS